MASRNPFDVVKRRYVTEKAKVLESLQKKSSNPSLKRCESPKYVFLVDPEAGKREIAMAVEQIYAENKIRVVSVNTIRMKPKRRVVRGRSGYKNGYKKAIVTLEVGNVIGDKV